MSRLSWLSYLSCRVCRGCHLAVVVFVVSAAFVVVAVALCLLLLPLSLLLLLLFPSWCVTVVCSPLSSCVSSSSVAIDASLCSKCDGWLLMCVLLLVVDGLSLLPLIYSFVCLFACVFACVCVWLFAPSC